MPFLEMRGIVKRYPGVLANDRVDLAVEAGEIHAVMGENGAGKSTLMGILYGLVQPDEGEIVIDGRNQPFRSPTDAIAAGLGMVHQAFKLFDSLTVWENVVYRAEPRRGPFIDRAAARRTVAELARRHGLPIDPEARVGALPVGVKQRIEILKALYRDARILILDEPTAVLTPGERDGLFQVMRGLAADGRTILFVTHKIHEVMAVTDRITVLRDGRVADHMVTAETDPQAIIRAMTGRNVTLKVDKAPAEPGRPLLEVEGLTLAAPGKPAVDGVSFAVRAGEIVGIAGVAGNGQTELIEIVAGLRAADAGVIRIDGRDVTAAGVAGRRAAGIAYVPEDRAHTGT
ncbi:MAG TPA: ATP-binding cassette domain-containing protein, partial [Inquilinus sp.]